METSCILRTEESEICLLSTKLIDNNIIACLLYNEKPECIKELGWETPLRLFRTEIEFKHERYRMIKKLRVFGKFFIPQQLNCLEEQLSVE